MAYNRLKHHRRSIRLKGYDYSKAGFYFVTLCVNFEGNPKWLPFGKVENGKMKLNEAGQMIENEWLKMPQRFPHIQLHEFVVMPNHFHAIVEITVGATLVVAPNIVPKNINPSNTVARNVVSQNSQTQGQPQGIARTDQKSVSDIMGAFKSIATVEYIKGVKELGWAPFYKKLWHRNYYEHIIRNEKSFHRISQYIINNPKKWQKDKFNK